ncbi:MAG: TRAP transporter small permease subunit [Pararhodobacter sp.]|nr:TRAP transporter small permease subunit [Pararhodobacter sp.]
MSGPDHTREARDAPFPERVVAPLSRIAGAISSLVILIAFGLTIYAVAMRYILNRAPMWTDELLGYLLVALIMAGMTEAYRRHDHISIDLVTAGLRGRAARLKNIWADLCVLVLALLLARAAWDSVTFSRAFGFYSIGPLEAPMWIPMTPVFLGFALLALMALARLAGRFWPGAGA